MRVEHAVDASDASALFGSGVNLKVLAKEDAKETLVEGGEGPIAAREVTKKKGKVWTLKAHGVVHPEREELEELFDELVERDLVVLCGMGRRAEGTLCLEQQVDLHLCLLDASLVMNGLTVFDVRGVLHLLHLHLHLRLEEGRRAVTTAVFVAAVVVRGAEGLGRQAEQGKD